MNDIELDKKILSDITIYAKYARYLPAEKRRETWDEIVDRNMNMHIDKFPHLESEIKKVYNDYVRTKKLLPSARSLQFAGRAIQQNPARIFNCAYAPIDSPDFFSEAAFLLLGGTGLGYSVQKHHIEKLPKVIGVEKPTGNQRKRRYLVGDSIEGWADAFKVLVESYFFGKREIDFDYSGIRPKGTRLVTAGGKAPGPAPLKIAITKIGTIFQDALDSRGAGTVLTSLEVHDIVCTIADSVRSGGIRRSALISLFDNNDISMLTCKHGEWWVKNPQRALANNSAVMLRSEVTQEVFFKVWKMVEMSGAGEPGISWTNNKDWGWNPCFSEDTLVHTKEGHFPIKELVGKEVEVHDGNNWVKINNFRVTGENQELLSVELQDGSVVKATPYHKFILESGETVQAKDLVVGNKLMISAITDKKNTINSILQWNSIASITDAGIADRVYCCTVPTNHTFSLTCGLRVGQCHEIALKPFCFCNLTEINGSIITTQEEFNEVARAGSFIGTLQASYTDFHYLRPIWRETAEEDALTGVGITGIATQSLLDLDATIAAIEAVKENIRVSGLIGINRAHRVTTVKPAGTTSLVFSSSSGVHAWHNDYYVRRITLGKDESVAKYLSVMHPELVEQSEYDPREVKITVPQKAPPGAILRIENVIDTLERVKKFNLSWVHPGHFKGDNFNNVSTTISVQDHEWDIVGNWMWENRETYQGIAVLPYNGGTYKQAPFEDITKEDYEERVKHLLDVDLKYIIEEDDETDMVGEVACAGGACEVK